MNLVSIGVHPTIVTNRRLIKQAKQAKTKEKEAHVQVETEGAVKELTQVTYACEEFGCAAVLMESRQPLADRQTRTLNMPPHSVWPSRQPTKEERAREREKSTSFPPQPHWLAPARRLIALQFIDDEKNGGRLQHCHTGLHSSQIGHARYQAEAAGGKAETPVGPGKLFFQRLASLRNQSPVQAIVINPSRSSFQGHPHGPPASARDSDLADKL